MAATPHPNLDQLRAYSLGELPLEAIDEISHHLASCPECETSIAAFDHTVDPLVASLGAPQPEQEYSQDSAFRRAMQSERVFWRWASREKGLRRLLAHVGQVAVDVLSECPSPAMVGSLLGHALGTCLIPSHRHEHAALMRIDPEEDGGSSHILQGPHFATRDDVAADGFTEDGVSREMYLSRTA